MIFAHKSRTVRPGQPVRIRWNPRDKRWSIIDNESGSKLRGKVISHATRFGATDVVYRGGREWKGIANPYPDNRIGKMHLSENPSRPARFESNGEVVVP